jgi:hypothetical protein
MDLPAMSGPFKGVADEGGIGALWGVLAQLAVPRKKMRSVRTFYREM